MTSQWDVRDCDGYICTVDADNSKDALSQGKDAINLDPEEETYWHDIYVECRESGESDRDFITVHPDPPSCRVDNHIWERPYDIVGGIKDNPGVWGNGGGVIIYEVCLQCGCGKVTDTWYTRPDTGEPVECVKYDPDQYKYDLNDGLD